jgi:hypothetical protein
MKMMIGPGRVPYKLYVAKVGAWILKKGRIF